MQYPSRIIKFGEADSNIVRAIAKRLVTLGYTQVSQSGQFDANFKSFVSLFQAQHADSFGRPLKVDGEIGLMSWGALFGVAAAPAGGGGLAEAALAMAIAEIGVREVPVGSNGGPRVDQYLAATGLNGGFFWCMAFIYWCFREAAKERGVANPFPKTAGCLKAWNEASAFRITKATAIAKPELVVPGAVFILDFGGGAGHTGFIRSSQGGALKTVEGNTNNDGSSNGVGVFELNSRNVMSSKLKGFIIVP